MLGIGSTTETQRRPRCDPTRSSATVLDSKSHDIDMHESVASKHMPSPHAAGGKRKHDRCVVSGAFPLVVWRCETPSWQLRANDMPSTDGETVNVNAPETFGGVVRGRQYSLLTYRSTSPQTAWARACLAGVGQRGCSAHVVLAVICDVIDLMGMIEIRGKASVLLSHKLRV